MHVQVNTDHTIAGHEALAARVDGVVRNALGRLGDHVTRVEVHLSDQDSSRKHGRDAMRCIMEARLERHQPVAATQDAATVDEAVDGAAEKLARLIENTLGRLRDLRRQRADPPPQETNPPGTP